MRNIIISNRLPFTIYKGENNEFEFKPSAGGLPTSLTSYLEQSEDKSYLWFGWPGLEIPSKNQEMIKNKSLKEMNSYPIFLSKKISDNFYEGFCNKVIWPLFHYFPQFAVYDEKYWQIYLDVNLKFCNEIISQTTEEDHFWIHDYHFFLLPQLIRKYYPKAKISFFLHIPFPSYEVFRLLPRKWQKGLLEGVLGADLIGFHTLEYTQYFLRSVLRTLGVEQSLGDLVYEGRLIEAKSFPLGINYEKFNQAGKKIEVKKEIRELKKTLKNQKVILSIDRLDYTKGIFNRLEGFEKFLEDNPDYIKKVTLVLIIIPSRVGVPHYKMMKTDIESLIGKINGRFGSIEWTPILYQFNSVSFDKLSALYRTSDAALITPLRDGMNLIAKEYISSRDDQSGVLILSEMTGASKELGEALLINPNSKEEIASSIKEALEMKVQEQKRRNQVMQKRLKNDNVFKWAKDFLSEVEQIKKKQKTYGKKIFDESIKKKIIREYKDSVRRLIVLDYDGTLTPIKSLPTDAIPSKSTLSLLEALSNDKRNEVIIISGREKDFLEKWFGKLPISLVAEHGVEVKEKWANWKLPHNFSTSWKSKAKKLLQRYTAQVPGSFIEEKGYSLAWHYRNAELLQASLKTRELIDDLIYFTSNKDLHFIHGKKVVEVKNINASKGLAASRFLKRENFDFILTIGDDQTDEDIYLVLPKHAYSLNVGMGESLAKYNIEKQADVIKLLNEMVSVPLTRPSNEIIHLIH